MKINRQLDYAVLGLHALYNFPGLSVQEIAERYHLPKHFLAKTFQKLKHDKILASKRGVQGGYAFARPLNKISFQEFYEAISGPIVTNHCLETKGYCKMDTKCPMYNILSVIQQNLSSNLKKITLQKIIHKNTDSITVNNC